MGLTWRLRWPNIPRRDQLHHGISAQDLEEEEGLPHEEEHEAAQGMKGLLLLLLLL